MKPFLPGLLVILAAPPLFAQSLQCPPMMYCGDAGCFAGNPDDPEAGTFVRDAMGDAPSVYVSEGTWMPATRTLDRGVLVFTGTDPSIGRVRLAVRQQGGTYLYTLPDQPDFAMTGTCKNWTDQ